MNGGEKGTSEVIHPVILSGGTGMRLWPLSRASHPKQFLPLNSRRTMLQETALRVDGRRFAAPTVVCNHEHGFMVAGQLREAGLRPAAIVLEPQGRNTAPAAAVAALASAAAGDPGALLLVLPADHLVADPAAFHGALEPAARAARDGALVTFGIRPKGAETGYGYIRRGGPWPGIEGCFRVSAFVEKPDRETARRYVDGGEHDWNSGIFLFRASRYLDELRRLHPAMVEACEEALGGGRADPGFLLLEGEAFARCQSLSIDYAVMEHTQEAAVVPVDMGWSDIGSFAALWEIGERDGADNVLSGNVVALGVRNSYLRSDGPLIAATGIEDAVVVATDDAVLVTTLDGAQDVKALVEALKDGGRREYLKGATEYRPWGHFRELDAGQGFRIDHVVLEPGGKLSLHRHRRRAEHWTVVKGSALVTRGDETLTVGENQSVFIPPGIEHRLENPGRRTLRAIEVRSGDDLGEDDEERLDDAQGRE